MNWYQSPDIDSGVIVSSRIRLARNIKKYPFMLKLDDQDALRMIEETKASIINDRTALSNQFEFLKPEADQQPDKLALAERHVISPEFLNSKKPRGILIKDDESVSIMINEEDHVRIQTISPGDTIDKAWDLADKIDNLIEATLEYAFDKDFGYLTSCPTNTGTGLRASFMVHIPMLEKSGQLKTIIQAIGKFGMTVRGSHGEGTEPVGGMYQISNQLTLGKSELEIVAALKNVTSQIIEQENLIRENAIAQQRDELADKLYRAYGVLAYCRKIDLKEAMNLLSELRIGFMTNILELKPPKLNIYNIMMNVQPGHMELREGKKLTPAEMDGARAEYIRSVL